MYYRVEYVTEVGTFEGGSCDEKGIGRYEHEFCMTNVFEFKDTNGDIWAIPKHSISAIHFKKMVIEQGKNGGNKL